MGVYIRVPLFWETTDRICAHFCVFSGFGLTCITASTCSLVGVTRKLINCSQLGLQVGSMLECYTVFGVRFYSSGLRLSWGWCSSPRLRLVQSCCSFQCPSWKRTLTRGRSTFVRALFFCKQLTEGGRRELLEDAPPGKLHEPRKEPALYSCRMPILKGLFPRDG